jgi:hypothetical protein
MAPTSKNEIRSMQAIKTKVQQIYWLCNYPKITFPLSGKDEWQVYEKAPQEN